MESKKIQQTTTKNRNRLINTENKLVHAKRKKAWWKG